jgi:hypothetical protein
MELNDIYDHLWNVATLILTSEDGLTILDEGYRPWPKIKHGSEESWDFYDIHERQKAADLGGLEAPTLTSTSTVSPYPLFNFSPKSI